MYISIIFSAIGARFAIFYKSQTTEFENSYNILDTYNDIYKYLCNIIQNVITWQGGHGEFCTVHRYSFKKISKFEHLIKISGFLRASNTGIDL